MSAASPPYGSLNLNVTKISNLASITPVVAPDGSGSIGSYIVSLMPGSADTADTGSFEPIRLDTRALFFTDSSTF